MKLTREEIIRNKYIVHLQKDNGPQRLVKFPESVDTDAGSVEMWTIPAMPMENLLTVRSTPQLFAETDEPESLDSVLVKDFGKIIVRDLAGIVIAES